MPWAFIQAMRRFTSAMTSGPMPSPASRRRLWVGMGRSLVARPARIAIEQRWVSQAACLEDDGGNWESWRLSGRRGPRRSLNLIFRLGNGRIEIDGPIAFSVSPLDLLGEFDPCGRQVQCQGPVLG